MFENSKGFCLPHFGDLIETAENKLNDAQKKDFYAVAFPLMQENMERLQKEVSWFVEKNDYRNKDKDWGTSADSIQRGMQKCAGDFRRMKPSKRNCKPEFNLPWSSRFYGAFLGCEGQI